MRIFMRAQKSGVDIMQGLGGIRVNETEPIRKNNFYYNSSWLKGNDEVRCGSVVYRST
jgi:hypothetical protein